MMLKLKLWVLAVYSLLFMVYVVNSIIICPETVVQAVNNSFGKDTRNFCNHATSPNGLNVIPGRSWGKTSQKRGLTMRMEFSKLGCGLRDVGVVPSCEEERGDRFVQRWRENIVDSGCPGPQSQQQAGKSTSRNVGTDGLSTYSKIECYGSPTNNLLCSYEGAVLDFRKLKVEKIKGVNSMFRDTRKVDKGFISLDCNWMKNGSYISDNVMIETDVEASANTSTSTPGTLSTDSADVDISLGRADIIHVQTAITDPEVKHNSHQCSVEITDTVVLFSPDLITNLAHTMNDYTNVLLTAWVANITAVLKTNVSLLIVDSLSYGGFMHDDDSKFGFYSHFENIFHKVLRAGDFNDNVVCLRSKLIMLPESLINLYWEGKLYDLPCSYVGPSGLLQRWNVHTRASYGLLNNPTTRSRSRINVVLMVREGGRGQQHKEPWREFSSTERDIFANKLRKLSHVSLTVVDMGSISYRDQLLLVADASILIGYHGAAIAHGLHMSIGTQYCCALIEGFGRNWMKEYKFNGNSLRSMGVAYMRVQSNSKLAFIDQSVVLVRDLVLTFRGGKPAPAGNIQDKSSVSLVTTPNAQFAMSTGRAFASCVLPAVLNDPLMVLQPEFSVAFRPRNRSIYLT